jgi:integrase
LETAPKIKLFPIKDARSPYPLSHEEQAFLFQELHDHLARMALFKVNTGLREQEVCRLKWEYEVKVTELEASVFTIPGEQVKHGEERLVVLNRVAKSVIDNLRGLHLSGRWLRRTAAERFPGAACHPHIGVTSHTARTWVAGLHCR